MPITDITKWLKTGVNLIQEDLVYSPVKLLNAIDSYPNFLPKLEDTPKTIHEGDIVRWHEWGEMRFRPTRYIKHNVMLGWRFSQGRYTSFELAIPELDHFGQCEVTPNWECDIQEVVGLLSSKANLKKFTSLDELAETEYTSLIDEITEENLQRNLAHNEIRIGYETQPDMTSDHFSRFQWDNRVFLSNYGGSHHFAAARYIADRMGRKVRLNGKLKTYSVNPRSVEALRNRFDIVVIDDSAEEQNQFHKAMSAFSATYLWRKLPPPYDNSRAIFLPKEETRSKTVASYLKIADAYDLGAFLQTLIVP